MKAENQITSTSQDLVTILWKEIYKKILRNANWNNFKLTIDVTEPIYIEKGEEATQNCITINPGDKPEINTNDLTNVFVKAVWTNSDLIILAM